MSLAKITLTANKVWKHGLQSIFLSILWLGGSFTGNCSSNFKSSKGNQQGKNFNGWVLDLVWNLVFMSLQQQTSIEDYWKLEEIFKKFYSFFDKLIISIQLIMISHGWFVIWFRHSTMMWILCFCSIVDLMAWWVSQYRKRLSK